MQVPVLDRLPVALHPLAVGRDLGHVHPGLERPALAGVHDHAHLGVGPELLPRDRELVAHVGRHRVQLVGPVVDQPADRPAALYDQAVERRVLHASPRTVATGGSQFASRFSTKAAGPSSWSGWPHMSIRCCDPARHASVSPSSSAPHRACLVARIAAGEFRAIVSASARATSGSEDGGSTTSPTIPSSYARAAERRSCRPASAIRMIGSIGDFRTSAIASYAVTCPIDTCGSRNVASDEHITMSASATKCSPPPAHTPFTAAI